jgi:wyosine [tRNA(Phe)-imidazoG37] synthetase (radical SAM superfamily)
LNGIHLFAQQFQGKLVTETMLLNGVNDNDENISGVSNFIHEIGVSRSYLAIPTRPTAETGICAPNEATLNRCYQIMAATIPHVEYLIGYEGDAFTFTGDIRHDLLSITAVHPLRESAVKKLLEQANAAWSLVDDFVAESKLKEVEYLGEHYFVRCFSNKEEEKQK